MESLSRSLLTILSQEPVASPVKTRLSSTRGPWEQEIEQAHQDWEQRSKIDVLQSGADAAAAMGSMPQTARLLQRLAYERESSLQEQHMMHAALDQARGLVGELQSSGLRDQARTVEASVEAVGQLINAAHVKGAASMMSRLR